MKLKRIGFFRELKHGDPGGPSLESAIQAAPSYNSKAAVAAYLRAGVLLIGTPGVVRDVIDPGSPIICTPNILTDGVWAWPQDLTHYVEKYNVNLPQEFISYLKARNYHPPEAELNLAECEL